MRRTARRDRNEDAANAIAEADWKDLHHRLRSIANRRIALEAKEAELLLEAEETRLYRRLSYTSMLEYMERELNYGPTPPANACASRMH